MSMLSLIQNVAGRPWAIQAEMALQVRGLIAKEGIAGLRHLVELKVSVHDPGQEARAAAGAGRSVGGSIAVVPIIGTLTQRGDIIDSARTRSSDAIGNEVRMFGAEPSVEALVLEADSPGGEVFGIPEAAAAIREVAKAKPVVASVNSMAASAAYWLASAASEVMVTPSGMVGSIGVYMLHVDVSKALEALGEKWTFVSAGKYKVEGNPAQPLTDEALGALQADVDGYYDMFVKDVAKGRSVGVDAVRSGFGEGRMVRAQQAVREKMADSVGTLQDAIKRAGQLARERRREGGGQAALTPAQIFEATR